MSQKKKDMRSKKLWVVRAMSVKQLFSRALMVVLGAALFPAGVQAIIIDLNAGTAFSFQDEGTTSIDQTSLLQTIDGVWAPDPIGTVTQSYYATGTSDQYFDAVSLNFNLGSINAANVTDAKLRFYTQKGDYATVDGTQSFNATRNTWEHYQILEGAFNPENQDYSPFNSSIVGSLVDFGGAGELANNSLVGWLEASVDLSWITSGDVDLTLRLWNARIDKVELEISVPEPSTLLLMTLGLAGLGYTRRQTH